MDRENYFFDIADEIESNKCFVLIIYDIVDNVKRIKLAKKLQGYGFRVQKSAFEAIITKKKYEKLLSELRPFVNENDSIRVYKIIGKGQVTTFGTSDNIELEDVVVV